jgi:hypothetical protein
MALCIECLSEIQTIIYSVKKTIFDELLQGFLKDLLEVNKTFVDVDADKFNF